MSKLLFILGGAVDNQIVNKLSVLMPVYNESRTLRTIVERVLKAPVDMEIELVCVNDGSTDSSLDVLNQLADVDERIVVVDQPNNLGKGKAIRTAIEHMTGDIGIVQDADLEYDPRDYPKVLAPILQGQADAVYGSRFAASEVRRVLFFWHALGNRLLTMLSNMANDLNLTDMETCYKAVRGDLLKSLRFTSDRFGFEPEVTARLAQWGARIYEVPISYHGRTYAEGKNIGWRDGLEALWLILKFRFIDTRATDDDSVATRQSIGRAPRFRRWVLDSFGPYVGEQVLEVDPGPGHTTSHLLDRRRLVAAEVDPMHVETLRRRFGHLENVEIVHVDLSGSESAPSGFDTALVFDGLQRADNPKHLLSKVSSTVSAGGHVLIHVPAHTHLYGPMDRALGHVRRFERDELADMIQSVGLEVVSIKAFNRTGSMAWRVFNAGGRLRVNSLSARTFDFLVPMVRLLDRWVPLKGLSWLAVARVP